MPAIPLVVSEIVLQAVCHYYQGLPWRHLRISLFTSLLRLCILQEKDSLRKQLQALQNEHKEQ